MESVATLVVGHTSITRGTLCAGPADRRLTTKPTVVVAVSGFIDDATVAVLSG
jgi:hypothetical protein